MASPNGKDDYIKLRVQTADNKMVTFSCEAKCALCYVKKKFVESVGNNYNEVDFMYDGVRLDDNRCLQDYDIKENAMIMAVYLKYGGGGFSFRYDEKMFKIDRRKITRIDSSYSSWIVSFFTPVPNWQCCYSNEIFEIGKSQICKVVWILRIDKSNDVDFGVCRDEWPIDASAHSNKNAFVMCSGSGNKYNGGKSSIYGSKIESGSTVQICLDMISKSLSFSINGNDQGVAFENLSNGKYCLVIGLSTCGDQVVLIK